MNFSATILCCIGKKNNLCIIKRGAPANAYVEIECKISKGGTYKVGNASSWGYAYLPLNITIEKGKINPVNISMGTALRDASGNKYFN